MSTKNPKVASFAEVINRNRQLQSLQPEESDKLVFESLLQSLKQVEQKYIQGTFKTGSVNYSNKYKSRAFVIDLSETLPDSQNKRIKSLADILQEEQHITISHTSIKEFWQRLNKAIGNRNYTTDGYPDPKQTLDPLCVLCGFKSFEDFVAKTFGSRTFVILILPLEGDKSLTFDAEQNLLLRYRDILEDEIKDGDLKPSYADINIIFNHDYTDKNIDYATAREIGYKHGADMVIFGHLFLRDVGNERIQLRYLMVDNLFLVPSRKWKSGLREFKFYELCEGDIPREIDCVIYWILGMKAYKQNEINESIRIFHKLESLFSKPNEEMLFRIGLLYDINNQPDKSETYYLNAISVDGTHYNSFLHLGINYILRDEFAKAKEYLMRLAASYEKIRAKNLLYKFARTSTGLLDNNKLGELTIAEKSLSLLLQSRIKEVAEFKEIWAMAHLELAEIYLGHFEKRQNLNLLEMIKDHFLSALRWSDAEEIHKQIHNFFVEHRFLDEASKTVKQYHPKRRDLISLYSPDIGKERMF